MFVRFVWLEYIAIISWNTINQLIFVLVLNCVLFEVRNEFLNTIKKSFRFKALMENMYFVCVRLLNKLSHTFALVLCTVFRDAVSNTQVSYRRME
jgi:hypothetical protein